MKRRCFLTLFFLLIGFHLGADSNVFLWGWSEESSAAFQIPLSEETSLFVLMDVIDDKILYSQESSNLPRDWLRVLRKNKVWLNLSPQPIESLKEWQLKGSIVTEFKDFGVGSWISGYTVRVSKDELSKICTQQKGVRLDEVQLLGGVKSPFENRVLLFVEEIWSPWDQEDRLYSRIKAFGSHLNLGFQ